MNAHAFSFHGQNLEALPSGALWWPAQNLLCVSDLHLGKAGRIARRAGALVPPYETLDTLSRLEAALTATGARQVVCLGDSFDDLDAAGGLSEDEALWITRLQAGRRWIWIEGNHDPGPLGLGGEHRLEHLCDGLTFRHIAHPAATAEISGHYHPKTRVQARGRSITRPSFLLASNRLILPAFGTYTGGLFSHDPQFGTLLDPPGFAILTGQRATCVPLRPN